MNACLNVLNEDEDLNKLNHMLLAFILEVKEPEGVTDYHLISLYNVLYKIIAKSLANKLKQCLPKIILTK